jgi:hypothetical protein
MSQDLVVVVESERRTVKVQICESKRGKFVKMLSGKHTKSCDDVEGPDKFQRHISAGLFAIAKKNIEMAVRGDGGLGFDEVPADTLQIIKASTLSEARGLNYDPSSSVIFDTNRWIEACYGPGRYHYSCEIPAVMPAFSPYGSPGTIWRHSSRKPQRTRAEFIPITNAPTNRSTLTDFRTVMAGQLRGLGYKENVNHIARKPDFIREPKVGLNVGIAPLGVIETTRGPLPPGWYPLTDDLGLCMAMMARSMKSLPAAGPEVDEFCYFCDLFFDKLVSRVPKVQEEPASSLDYWITRAKATGKTASQIESVVRNYQDENQPWDKHSMFNKFECSLKHAVEELGLTEEEVDLLKSRLIMTVSDKALVDTSPMLLIYEAILKALDRFHLKNESPEDAIAKVLAVVSGEHMVADASSFELFVSWKIQMSIAKFYERLCDRDGYARTWSAYHRVNNLDSYAPFLRTLKRNGWQFKIQSRKSGDGCTSAENTLLTVVVQAFLAFKTKGWTPSDSLQKLSLVAEGDDVVTDTTLWKADYGIAHALAYNLSQDVKGTRPGDTDFLRIMWVDGNKILNIGRNLKVLWVMAQNADRLRTSKQLGLLRQKALCLHHQHPNHPVLSGLIYYIGLRTRGVSTNFKNINKYLNTWKGEHNISEDRSKKNGRLTFPVNFSSNDVDLNARIAVASGCTDFPGIPIPMQLLLEERFSRGDFFVGSLLDSFPEVKELVEAGFPSQYLDEDSQSVKAAKSLLGLRVVPRDSGPASG